MTENEIIDKLDDIWILGKIPSAERRKAAKEASILIEEIQQYHAIGTVEECQMYKDLCEQSNLIDISKYREIGTVEEYQKASEVMKRITEIVDRQLITEKNNYEEIYDYFCEIVKVIQDNH